MWNGTRLVAASRTALTTPILSVTLVLLLSASWLLVGYLVSGVSPLLVAAGRTGASFIVFAAIVLFSARSRSEARIAARRGGTVALLGLLGFFLYYAGTMLGAAFIGPSRTGLIISLLPSLTFVIGAVAFGERVTRNKVLGACLALGGALVYAISDMPASEGHAGAEGLHLIGGALLVFGGTASYALYGYVFRARMADLSALSALPAITGAGAAMLAVATMAKAGGAIALIYLVGGRVIHPLFKAFARRRQPDVFMALILLSTFGIAALSAAAGLSMALGALIAGLL
ncbi:MAG TPA: hypothetical protein DEH03_06915, partial [Brevundimonas sp.]|nr:hypothetical protein [Brevundimonas sp.]